MEKTRNCWREFFDSCNPLRIIILLIDRRARWVGESCVARKFLVWVQQDEYLNRSSKECRYQHEFLSIPHGRGMCIKKKIVRKVMWFSTLLRIVEIQVVGFYRFDRLGMFAIP